MNQTREEWRRRAAARGYHPQVVRLMVRQLDHEGYFADSKTQRQKCRLRPDVSKKPILSSLEERFGKVTKR
jgi:hypothetical protein